MKTPRWFTCNHLLSYLRIATAVTLTSAAAAMAFVAANNSNPSLSGKSAGKGEAKLAKLEMRSVRNKALANHFKTLIGRNKSSGEASPIDGLAQEAYDNRAYPAKWIAPAQRKNARAAANAILTKSTTFFSPLAASVLLPTASWVDLGPSGVPASGLVVNESTAGTTGTIFSGRTTAIAVDPNCSLASCTVFIGAAGGGVWKTTNALAATPSWSQVSDGQIPSNAIGSLAFDASGNLYAGTGEPNGSSDSEAGVGLYKSTDGGSTWSVVSGTDPNNAVAKTGPCADGSGNQCPVAAGRPIGAIAVDPADASHILIGTDVARHGSSSVNGGRFAPPGSAQVGLYESTDGGSTFTAKVILPQDTVNPASPNGGDFFRGGCSDIELYRPGSATETQVYAAFFDYGVFRRSMTLDGDSVFHQIFQSAGDGKVANSLASRHGVSLAPI